MIPLSDLAGHRGAVQMWRAHCESRRAATIEELNDEVDRLLRAPRPLPPDCGTLARPYYAWIRPSSIPVTDHAGFPYHHTPAGLARIAQRLIAEAGAPAGLDKILGFNFVLTTTFTPHGLVHRIGANGNHRAALLRAAGFPVALALITPQRAPWTIPSFTSAERLFRLLYRSGLLSRYRRVDGDDQVDCESIAAWFLDVDSPVDARANLLAFDPQLAERLLKQPADVKTQAYPRSHHERVGQSADAVCRTGSGERRYARPDPHDVAGRRVRSAQYLSGGRRRRAGHAVPGVPRPG
jgi:hypothetical protein